MMNLPDRTLTITGREGFTAFIKKQLQVRFVHLQWVDYTNTVRVRVLTLRHFQSLLQLGQHLAVCRHYLSLIDTALPFTDRDPERPSGQCYLIPDFDSLRLHPGHDEQAAIFCYFGHGIPTEPDFSAISFKAPTCPRQALGQAIQCLKQFGLDSRVGFELEFGCRQTRCDTGQVKNQVHQSSGLRALESFMLPVLCSITDALESVGIPIEQFHCEGSENAYELVTGPQPPLEAVDSLTTSKETTRRVCRHQNIELTFNPSPPAINGLHMNISITGPESEILEDNFLAGILAHMKALCGFALVRPESYDRTVAGQWCTGRYVAWGTENRELVVRKRRSCLWEVRVPDAAAQMYLFLAAVLISGAAGIQNKTKLALLDCPADPALLSADDRLRYGIEDELPSSPSEAFRALLNDRLMVEHFGEELLTTYVTVQEAFNKQLENVGPKGSDARRDWLTARI
ncbi:hypothetical protein CEP52_017246 [Fusarium oligoseptatum]|uniref:Glutamine synthetase n=1 Tax=Fusarium oligoseptatum TaxID=2604345 RepID=A0A428RUD8_9HYPO|nr:hypothetical protein CEP52_017246 [Fusarium oligoseptatum]